MSLLRHLACLLLGLVVALADVVVHRSAFPAGLVLSVVTAYAVPWRLLRSAHPRTAASFVAGWLVLFAVVVAGRPEGDYALAGDLEGYSLMAAGFGLAVLGIVSLAGGRRGGG